MDTTPDRANKKRRKMQLQKRFKNGKDDDVDGKERVTLELYDKRRTKYCKTERGNQQKRVAPCVQV